MTLAEIEAVRQEYRRQHAKHIAEGRRWPAKVAKLTGWAVGTLRHFRLGRYWGNNELIAETLKPVLENLKSPARRPALQRHRGKGA